MTETRRVQNTPGRRDEGIEAAFNGMVTALVDAGIVVHHDADAANLVATPDASSLATSKTLAKALALAVVAHGADTGAHTTADAAVVQAAAWASAPNEPADLAEVGGILNELKADLNLHVAQTDHHRGVVWGTVGGDGIVAVKAITTADYASTQGEANALANAIKAFLNNHIKAAAPSIELIDS